MRPKPLIPTFIVPITLFFIVIFNDISIQAAKLRI
jgi:hypothetical protein